jgi:S-adenosylmethionine-diacylgycerolhomoserine-N-methlytransferase
VVAADSMIPLAAAVLHSGAEEPERVLEVECGGGDGALFLAREFPRARVRGVDASAEHVARATARVGLDPEGRIAFKQGAPRRLPFPDAHFDLVVQAAGRLAAAEAARVLRPGGRLLLVHAERPSGRLGLRRRWTDRALARGGFELLQEGGAGGGSFLVMRLHGGASRASSD